MIYFYIESNINPMIHTYLGIWKRTWNVQKLQCFFFRIGVVGMCPRLRAARTTTLTNSPRRPTLTHTLVTQTTTPGSSRIKSTPALVQTTPTATSSLGRSIQRGRGHSMCQSPQRGLSGTVTQPRQLCPIPSAPGPRVSTQLVLFVFLCQQLLHLTCLLWRTPMFLRLGIQCMNKFYIGCKILKFYI